VSPGYRDLREWVEQLAAQLERDGLPRMAGRIFAWLLVCEPSEQTMEDLAAALQGSRASMSTMTRLLEGAGFVERVRRPGARSDVFRVPEGKWGSFWESQITRVRQVTATLARGAELMASRPLAARQRIDSVLEQYRFLARELPALYAHWAGAGGPHDLVTPVRRRPDAPSRRSRGGESRRRRV